MAKYDVSQQIDDILRNSAAYFKLPISTRRSNFSIRSFDGGCDDPCDRYDSPTATHTSILSATDAPPTTPDTPPPGVTNTPSIAHPKELEELARWSLESALHLAWSHDSAKLVAGASSGQIVFYDPKKLETKRIVSAPALVEGIAFSPGNGVFAYSFTGASKLVWDVDSGDELKLKGAHMDSLRRGAISPNALLLATQSSDDAIQIWDLTNGHKLLTLDGQKMRGINRIVFSPDSKLLATTTTGGQIGIWDAASGKQLHAWVEKTDDVWSLAFSRDNKMLALGLTNGPVLWDVESEKTLDPLIGRTSPVSCVVFSPDGKTLASASWDGITLWDIANKSELITLETYHVRDMAFSPDSLLFAAASSNGYGGLVQLWGLQP